MGLCLSSDETRTLEYDENVVYVMDEEEGEEGARRLASLYSQRGRKGPNQDSVILCQGFGTEDGLFCGVFDGHGRHGHLASRLVRDYLPFLVLSQRNALFLTTDDYDFPFSSSSSNSRAATSSSESSSPTSLMVLSEWQEACVRAFQSMDSELKLQTDMDCSFSGTTAVCIIKQGRDLITVNLGDSRAILGTVSKGGFLEAVQLTTDMKPSIPEEAERILKSGGRVFATRDEPGTHRVWLPDGCGAGLAMSRSFGDFQLKRHGVISTPQVVHRSITANDLFIILATDGVWDVLSNDEVATIVWSTPSKQDASRAVAEAAVHRWRTKFPSSKVDDCSVACLFLQKRRQATSVKLRPFKP